MARVLMLLAGVLIGGLLMYFGFNYHIVIADHDYYVIARQQAELKDVYADIRDWDAARWAEHPQLARAVTAAGHGELVKKTPPQRLWEQLLDKVGGRPTP